MKRILCVGKIIKGQMTLTAEHEKLKELLPENFLNEWIVEKRVYPYPERVYPYPDGGANVPGVHS